jgi:hypothetical protein
MSRDPLRLEVLAAGSGLVLLLGAAIASGDSDGSGLDVFGTGLLLNLGTALLLAGVLVRLQRHIAARLDEAEHATREFEADIVRRVEHIDRRISEVVDRTVTERRVVADGDATSLAVPAAADPMPPLADPGPPSRAASAVEAGGSAQPTMSVQSAADRSGVQARDDVPAQDSRLAPGPDREYCRRSVPRTATIAGSACACAMSAWWRSRRSPSGTAPPSSPAGSVERSP